MFEHLPRKWLCFSLEDRTEYEEERIWEIVQSVNGRVSSDSRMTTVLFWVQPEYASLLPLVCGRLKRVPSEDYV